MGVVLFADRHRFRDCLMHPIPDMHLSRSDAPREGLFLLRNGRSHVFAYQMSEPTRTQILSREIVHALLYTSHRNLTCRIDKGLPEYYKHDNPAGIDRQHLKRLKRRLTWGWQANLGRQRHTPQAFPKLLEHTGANYKNGERDRM